MSQRKVLVVDDEPDIRELIGITLTRMGISSSSAPDIATAKRILENEHFDFCITDLKLTDGNGIELVKYIQRNIDNLPVAVISAYGTMESAIEALKAGAFDFVSKPINLEILRKLVNASIKVSPLPEASGENISRIVGDTDVIAELRKRISKLARNQAPVHITGESGTGKELVAREIHYSGPRAENDFVAVNCGAIPSELMESELFGHVKGSFSGAISDHLGLIRAADGGSLFLDEIAELPLHMQAKLLRVIQERYVRPVGSNKEYYVDIRIISATNEDLGQLVEQGQFREDLYYRVNVIDIHVPALRERPEDVILLIDYMLKTRFGGQGEYQLDNEALAMLQRYQYPGNVRELENIIERAVALSEGDTIRVEDLLLQETSIEKKCEKIDSLLSDVDEIERIAIVEALGRNRWNRTAAAKELGMSLRQLRYRLDKYNISV